MNKIFFQDADILTLLLNNTYQNQRELAVASGHSLGVVNRCIKNLRQDGLLDNVGNVTAKGVNLLSERSPKKAIILAAGYGMRMVPINMETPKALLTVNGEVMIERTINQLHEAGISDIYVVVGFLKEKFEYLIDDFGVKLVMNTEYSRKNNIYSLWKAIKALTKIEQADLSNTYIIPSDIWCERNPFSNQELLSWYMVSDLIDQDSKVRVNRKNELVKTDCLGNAMIGISYLTGEEATAVQKNIEKMILDGRHDESFWEDALFEKDRMLVQAKVVHSSDFIELNTYEQLRDFDENSEQLKSRELETAATALHCKVTDITNISVLKKGMTNRSFLFEANGYKYIMRIPGEGTDQLINRREEAEVYTSISGKGFCDDPVYINPENGYKITIFLNGVRTCDENAIEVEKCIKKLKTFHNMNLTVDHVFDIFGQIEFYEKLWKGSPSAYRDYERTKQNVLSLKDYIEKTRDRWCLTHIDAVPDNFLFYQDASGNEQLQLTDWEYAGMQDPHVDIAMFAIYSYYDKKQVDQIIDLYFDGTCEDKVRCKIYCYVAACGLLWSNWTEFKSREGIEFGEYGLIQYRYAKDFYRYAQEMMERENV